ncbi:phosphonate metabolism protein/1,5-bisphosphokinase (PRPP-forming) PhnN [Pseudomonas sp. Irchel s3h17]|uniref:phosphonate metabolism protein/1,5-bisphosphokinase (PRPP-forming) PhnN n=1 Tax=Pseudomonas sp. Irchel s3h17 TaxID=2009182 RepID=UPI000BA4E10E|nr:phosphonate metabolism protein/1,5-bisphosphokinase (PRPP-forming) PhnN [Pseudomonas sp. Irchel s3h17]
MGGRLIYLMGPSGAGKDSLIDAARDALARLDCLVARRVITRSAESVGEEAIGVTPQAFAELASQGGFALSWYANGLDYGIPVQIDQWLAEGRHVLVNGSRGHLQQARVRYPTLIPILLTVSSEVLRRRLERRGRESAMEIEARLERNALFASRADEDQAKGIFLLDNSGELSSGVSRLLDLLRHEGIHETQLQA